MGRVRNLKTTLNCWASKILAELFSAFIRRRAKLIMKKRGNSSQTTSSQNPLTQESLDTIIATSSADTTERITMEKSTEEIIDGICDWAKTRVDELTKPDEVYNRLAIIDEYHEWFDLNRGEQEVIIIDEITKAEFNRYTDND